jgi:MoxR-like ATPase
MTSQPQSLELYRDDVRQLLEEIDQVIFGMRDISKFILIALICNDHILLEDVPGTGKTMLTNTIASLLDLRYKRVQGTPDLLPGDLTGVNIFNMKENVFEFLPGPIFTNLLLFDEINRASPKTQSALLESMAERQVSVDNQTFQLEPPFIVIATQNPVEHIGTYPLPQAQLDRFLIKTKIGYPSRTDEMKIMYLEEDKITQSNEGVLTSQTIFTWQEEFKAVHLSEDIANKILDIVEKTRQDSSFQLGISPRSVRKLARALKASAYIHQRDFVNKDDIFDLFIPIMSHRVFHESEGNESKALTDLLHAANF